MIDRVEVLQDGASSIYGSDAIAGRGQPDHQAPPGGFVASAQLSGYKSDGFTQNYQLSWGNGGRRTAAGRRRRRLCEAEWHLRRGSGDFRLPRALCHELCRGRLLELPSERSLIGAIFPNGGDETLISAPTNTPTIGNFRDFVSPADRFNFAPFNYMQIPLERYGVFGNLKYEITPDLHFSRRASGTAASPRIRPPRCRSALALPRASRRSSTARRSMPPTRTIRSASRSISSNFDLILRRFVEGGPRRFFQTVDTTYGVATLDGQFTALNSDWYWDINGVYGNNKAKQTMYGNINSSNLRRALGPVALCTAPCVPFNFFGGAGSITQAMIDYVGFVQHDSSSQRNWDFTANLSGKLFELPGGPLGIAAGIEYRKLTGRFDPDPVVAAGFSSDIPAQPTPPSGYNVKEAYAELNAPILANDPDAELLEINAAARISDYSTFGSTTTFKGGVNWKPIKALRLRGSYAEGFRAPQIGELFGTPSRFDQSISDPCSNDSTAPRTFLNDATVKANCIAAGVPANGSYAQANPQISVRLAATAS